MQGINGVELYPSVYNYLVTKIKADVPLLEYEKTENDEAYTCEKDVENKLIKPLISKLGYTEDEYEQQLYIEIGNHNKALIPDFVLLPDKTHGHTSGFGIIEAKRSIPSEKVLKEVFIQARSYARVLSKNSAPSLPKSGSGFLNVKTISKRSFLKRLGNSLIKRIGSMSWKSC